MATPFSDYSDEATQLYQAAAGGDVITVTTLLPHTTPHQRGRALTEASGHDQPMVIDLLLPTELGVYGHHVITSAVQVAARAGAVKALECLLSQRPTFLSEGIESALLMDPPQQLSLAFLGPKADATTWDAVIEALFDNEDTHGLNHEACLERAEVLLPWMSTPYQQKLLRTHGVALLPHTEARVQAHDRAKDAQQGTPDTSRRPRRRT